MTASEKLKALEEVTHTWPNGFSMSRMEATGRVLAALPEIIAVVEAGEALYLDYAEMYEDEFGGGWGGIVQFERDSLHRNPEAAAFRASILALDEKLGEELA